MKEYFKPLWIFVGGQLLLLILWIFLPSIGDGAAQLAADTAEHASTFWGWSWAVSSIKVIIIIVGELLVLYFTARAFLDARS